MAFSQATAQVESPLSAKEIRTVVLSQSEQLWLQQHPVVHWGADPQWPPFSSFDPQGKISGIDVDIVKLLAARTGLHLEFVETPTWSETLRKAGTGEIDFIGGIAHTEDRERLLGLRFTEMFCNFPTAIVTRKDMPFATSLRDIKSRKVALPKDYATTEELRALYPETRVLLTENEEESMLAVAESKADATALNLASASYIVHMRGLTNLKISGFTEIEFFLSVAVRKDLPELYSILKKGLSTIGPREKEAIYAAYITPETLKGLNWRTWQRWLIYSLIGGTAVLMMVVLHNQWLRREIGLRKTAEASLREAGARLEDYAQQRDSHARQMETLNRDLTLANQDLESFSYSVSHDLIAPLRRLRVFADLTTVEGNLDSTAKKYLKAIQQEGKRMGDLIEALLAFARVGRAKLQLARVNLEELTQEIIHELEVDTRGRDLKWEVQPLPTVECDRGLIKQVLVNLMSNAVKFTRIRAPAIIKIGVLPAKQGDHETVFFVKDNGVGFEKSQAGKLFEAFHRLHRPADYEGSGIGLANVKRIISKHGGRVWAESEVNVGSTFYFALNA
jgi:signal transduction histidine kinase